MIYFTSDLHFRHANIIPICGRPFESIREMDETLIKNWNNIVKPEDEVYILGDFTMSKDPKVVDEILEQLNGKKYLIIGNHDQFTKRYTGNSFEFIAPYYELRHEGQLFCLCHYPIAEWNGYYRGAYNLHGHQHNHKEYNDGNIEIGLKRYDVGVDANDFKPISINQIVNRFNFGMY